MLLDPYLATPVQELSSVTKGHPKGKAVFGLLLTSCCPVGSISTETGLSHGESQQENRCLPLGGWEQVPRKLWLKAQNGSATALKTIIFKGIKR